MQDNSDWLSSKTSNPFDFSKLPNIHEKLSQKEIDELNKVFLDEEIQEIVPKKSSRIVQPGKILHKIAVRGASFTVLLIVWLSFSWIQFEQLNVIGPILEKWWMPIFWICLFFSVAIDFILWWRKYHFDEKNKDKLVNTLGKILHSQFQFSYTDSYWFREDLPKLQTEWLILDSTSRLSDTLRIPLDFAILQWAEINDWGSKKSIRGYLAKAYFTWFRKNATILIRHKTLTNTMKHENWKVSFLAILFATFPILISLDMIKEDLFSAVFTFSLWLVILAIIIFIWLDTRKQKKQKYTLENVEFNEIFQVRSNDEIESRMIVTPALMDRILTFSRKTQQKYSILFSEDTIYFRREIKSSFLEFNIHEGKEIFMQSVVGIYIELREILSLVHDLNLMYYSKPSPPTTKQVSIEIPTTENKIQLIRI